MKAEITLQDALEQLKASSVRERTEGLANIKHIFRSNRRFDTLSDASFQEIYNVLFQITLSDQSAYLNAKTATIRTAAENRLSACASALRMAVEAGLKTLKLKTIRSLLEHVQEALHFPNGNLCDWIAVDYTKYAVALLTYQPHVEHLAPKDRERFISFCVKCMGLALSDTDEEDVGSGASNPAFSRTTNGRSYRSSLSNFKDPGGSQSNRSVIKQVAEEMAASLALLTAPPNARGGSDLARIFKSVIEFLKDSSSTAASQVSAFATMNHILTWARNERTDLLRELSSAIVRLVKVYWSARASGGLKTELLKTLILLHPYLAAAIAREDLSARSETKSLLHSLSAEYGGRQEKDQLHVEDLRLELNTVAERGEHEIGNQIFLLCHNNARAESNWTVAWMIASLNSMLAQDEIESASSGDEDDDDIRQPPRKRQRLSMETEDLLNETTVGTTSTRTCALQTLTFAAQQRCFTPKNIVSAIAKLSRGCTEEKSGSIAPWSLLALASLASQRASSHSGLDGPWLTVWQLASKAMSNATTCRVACHLLLVILKNRLVSQQSVTELTQALVHSIDLSGPALLADSVVYLMMELLQSAEHMSPASTSIICDSVLKWLFRNFLPSKFEVKRLAGQHALYDSQDIVRLITRCLGQVSHVRWSRQFPVWHSLAGLCLSCTQDDDLLEYLLLLPKAADVIHPNLRLIQAQTAPPQTRPSCETITLNNLLTDLQRALDMWAQVKRDEPWSINSDMFAYLCTAADAINCIAFCTKFRNTRRQAHLQRQIGQLLDSVVDFVSLPSCRQDKVDIMLTIFSSTCTRLVKTAESTLEPTKCEDHMCQTIHKAVERRAKNRDSNGQDVDDAMELDDEYESQDSRSVSQQLGTPALSDETASQYGVASLRSSVSTYAAVIVALRHKRESGSSSTAIVDYITALPPDSILSSRCVVSRLSDLGVELLSDDAERLLEHCTKEFLEAYVYERSEVATGVILDIMSNLVSDWTNSNSKALFELGIDMYNWYTTTALSGGVLSPNVQKRVATLLLQLFHIDTDYGHDSDVPSVRTSLFELVKLGSVPVLYYLANRISTIFGLFVLSSHGAIFDDLQNSLPQESDQIEGIAMRLLFLGKLASAWHSLLRECVYYMFDAAGRVQESSAYATRSITELALSLGFESSRDLFRIFAPQLLYSWLEKYTVSSLPFAAFQYGSLSALITHNQGELTALLMIRGNGEGTRDVERALKTNSAELVAQSFAKCCAYCIAHDLSPSKASQDESAVRLRELLGKEQFKMLVRTQYPAIIGEMFVRLQQEDVQNKWLDKRQEYATAAKALSEMKNNSHSEVTLPDSQEPHFKSKYLVDQIERLCRKGGLNLAELWTPSFFSLAARVLFDSIEDALGPLHTCSVIRKLRLLIAISGKPSLELFPLQLLTHTLRPYLNDSQCADDVIGVLQYVLHHGKDALCDDLPFLFGTTTLIVLRMRKHSMTRQESTTQESQHRQTVQRMQTFQTWLVKYLNECYTSSGLPNSSPYASLLNVLGRVNLPGNAQKGSPESALLLLLIGHDAAKAGFLNKSDRDEALVMLSEGFVPPNTIADDCLAGDADCVMSMQNLWSDMHITGLSSGFIAWAANAVGRSYAYSGRRPTGNIHPAIASDFAVQESFDGVAHSQARIAQRLSAMLFSRSLRESSMADFTLRSIPRTFTVAQEAHDFEPMLQGLVPIVAGGTCGYVSRFATLVDAQQHDTSTLHGVLGAKIDISLNSWLIDLSLALCDEDPSIAILPALKPALRQNASLAYDLVPCMVHMLLEKQFDKKQTLRTELSTAISEHLESSGVEIRPRQKYLLEMLLYLRRQSIPTEKTVADRLRWLEVDWIIAAQAAERCGMPLAALMFAESASSPQSGGRRASSRASLSQVSLSQIPQELLLSIFKKIEEPDSFYGVEQPASLASVLDRLDYEADGYKSLMFRSAQTDTDLRRSGNVTSANADGVIRSLSILNLDSITFSLLNNGFASATSADTLVNTARRLQQWDVASPTEGTSGAITMSFTAFSELSRTTDKETGIEKLKDLIVKNTRLLLDEPGTSPSPQWLSGLAVLVEAADIVRCPDETTFETTCGQMRARHQWMELSPFEDFRLILSSRQTLFSMIARNKALSGHVASRKSRSAEIRSLVEFSRLARNHGQQQEALIATGQLKDLVLQAQEFGLTADGVAMLETASVLWNSGEAVASVRMLRDTLRRADLANEDVPVGKPGLLAQLGHQLAEARLEKPETILSDYLKPAIEGLKGRVQGDEAGKVFHEFASFCDRQLQNPESLEDFTRMQRLRQRKLEEVQELHRLAKSTRKSEAGQEYEGAFRKAKKWFDIDDADYQTLKASRDTFLEGSLRNYGLALSASDHHDISVLRLFAMWLENAEDENANKIMAGQLPKIPSWKFVVLMNQLMSRLESDRSLFQTSLKGLAERICSEHPHHSLHHLYATTTTTAKMDAATKSRYDVANNIRQRIESHSKTSQLLKNVFLADSLYNDLAFAAVEPTRSSSGIHIKDVPPATKAAKTIPGLGVPPATINVNLRRDGKYDGVPVITRIRSLMKLMSGISKPKKVVAVASDGQEYAQLFKSGDDDLRQDAIMEQVFGQVSKMLQNHETTRRRNLHVRTYNVVPLSPKSGIIEFVPNTVALTEFLSSAHARYHPKDLKYSAARDIISDAQKHSVETRIKAFRKVCDQLQPVLRHFFFERFRDPDEWFSKRTAYTRTTATISILGHVLGLGDRHCQNIMLDEQTGEVVHIDLGIAFEAGKVLPVPELVPFRLSRDVVDGMGITKTEGVFRRCCEFTMDALREDKDSIMTLLNVLRYDPLYTWSVSPLRAKRMQEQTERSAAEGADGSSRKNEEVGEADRALSIVEKKLSKTLSTAAAVNELILQATDEKNLATLFVGWSAFF